MLSEPEVLTAKKSCVRRIALSLQYDGSGFCGWQRQSEGISVQGVLEEAIRGLDPLRPIKTVASGRTDAGVHAAAQVVHFDCTGPIPAKNWPKALNGRLPKTIRVLEAVDRSAEWHACFSAKYRRYRYMIYNARRPNLFLAPWTWHRYQYRLDEVLMRKSLEGLLGNHDFSAFLLSGSKRSNSLTTIQDVQLDRDGDLLVLEIQATGFLYGMVRLLVGQLVAIGEHKLTIQEFEKRWKGRRRSEVKESAPAKGLCFLRTGYAQPVFSESACFDCYPRFFLPIKDSPIQPK